MSDSPTSEFVHDLTKKVGTPAGPTNQPKVPFQTALRLNAEQEKKMLDHAFARLDETDREMGREQTLQPTWWTNLLPANNAASAAQGFNAAATFLGKRSRFDATNENDVSWRPFTMGVTSIFMDSNLVVPLSRRINRQMVAKAQEAFFGTDPWYAVDPTPGTADQGDDKISERVERFSQFKQREAGAKDNHRDAVKRAITLGECAVKTTYKVRDQIFDTEATVLQDVEGRNILGTDGNVITPEDQTEEADDGLGNKHQVLSRDKQTVMPESPMWVNTTLSRRQVLFEGAVSECIYYKDFLCPLTAKNVQEADFCCHLYDKNVMEFVDMAVKRGMVDDTTDARKETAQRMVVLLQTMQQNNSQPKSAETMAIRPNEATTEIQSGPSSKGPVAEFAEMYIWFDANGDGVAENIMIIADRKTRTPIYYDHVANVTTDGLRPIQIVRINPVPGRWYGLGIIELFESYQTVTDLLVNRWNFSQAASGRVTFWRPSNTQEGQANPNLVLNWGKTYTLIPGVKMEETLEVVYLNDTKFEAIHEMIEFFMQLAMNESGVSNANDDQAAGMQSAKLATGILEVKKSGDQLFNTFILDLTESLESLLNREINTILANINPVEAYTYLQGDTMQIDKLTPKDVRGLKFKCSIKLTTHKNQQTLQQSAQASALVKEFYELSPEVQAKVAPFYRNEIRALCPDQDPDIAIDPVKPAPAQPPMADPLKPSVAIAAKWTDLPEGVQQQLLMKMANITENEETLDAANKAAIAHEAKKTPDGKTKPAKPKATHHVDATPFEAQLGQKKTQPKNVAA